MNSRTDRILHIGLIAAFALPIFVYAYLGVFSRFITDDYCAATKVQDQGVLNAVVNDYNNWYGRVSASFANNLAAQAGPYRMPFTPVLVLGVWLAGLLWAMHEILTFVPSSRFAAILLACLLLFATLAGSPQIYQSLYWLSGVYTYTTSVMLLPYILALILFGRRSRASGVRRAAIAAMIFTLAFAAGAFSEPYAAAQGLAFAGALIAVLGVTRSAKHPASLLVGAALVGSVVAVIVLLASPGNAIRQASFQRAPSLVSSAPDALTHAAAFMVASVASFSPGGALAALFFPALVAFWHVPAQLLEAIPRRRLRIAAMASILAGLVLIAAFMFPAMYATSLPPPSRAYTIPQFILVCSFAAAGWLIGMYARKTIRHPSPAARIAVSAFAVLLLGIGPVLTTVQALTLTAPLSTFAAEFDQREQFIHAAKTEGETRLVVAPFTVDIAERVGLETIGDDPAFWVNDCAAQYYGLEALVAQ